MTDTNKFQRGGCVPPEQEDALASVAGGVTFKGPQVDVTEITRTCPVCGATFADSVVNGQMVERMQCPKCKRMLRLVGSTLVEE